MSRVLKFSFWCKTNFNSSCSKSPGSAIYIFLYFESLHLFYSPRPLWGGLLVSRHPTPVVFQATARSSVTTVPSRSPGRSSLRSTWSSTPASGLSFASSVAPASALSRPSSIIGNGGTSRFVASQPFLSLLGSDKIGTTIVSIFR
jgi:hypothetical protein